VTISSASSRRFLKRTVEAKGQATSSKANPDVSSDGALVGKDMSRIRADFEGLLGLAESLQQSLDKHADAYGRSCIRLQILALLIVIEFVIIVFGVMHHFGFEIAILHSMNLVDSGAVVPILTLSVHYTVQLRHYALDMKYAERADKRDLSEVVELLREIEPVVAKEENLSVLERVQIRIRLSRFGVGSSAREGAGAVSKAVAEDARSRKSCVDQELAKPLR
jgi:hypothetical protein